MSEGRHTDAAGEGEQREAVGSLAEEAAKLAEALRGLSQEASAGGGLADVAGLLWQDLNQHLATGDNCRYCPICRLMSAAREPEVRGHLAAAATSLASALASALDTRVPGGPEKAPDPPTRDPGDR